MSGLPPTAVTWLWLSCGGGVVPPEIGVPVAQTESAFDPLLIHVNARGADAGAELRPGSVTEAVDTAAKFIAQGRSVDVGLMQINWQANGWRFGPQDTPAASRTALLRAFDPCASIRAGHDVLAEAYLPAVRAVLSRYNTGSPDRGLANGYVAAVERAARDIGFARPGPTAAGTPFPFDVAEPPAVRRTQTVAASAPAPLNPFVGKSSARELVYSNPTRR